MMELTSDWMCHIVLTLVGSYIGASHINSGKRPNYNNCRFIDIYSLNGGSMLHLSDCLMSNSAPEPVVILLVRNLEMC